MNFFSLQNSINLGNIANLQKSVCEAAVATLDLHQVVSLFIDQGLVVQKVDNTIQWK